MKIEFCKEVLPYNTTDVYRRIAVDKRYIGEAHRGSTSELWAIEIHGKRLYTETSDYFSLTVARGLIAKKLRKGK